MIGDDMAGGLYDGGQPAATSMPKRAGWSGVIGTRDYFAEMYVAGVMADAGWNLYFPHRDVGFDMIATIIVDGRTLVRPVQVKGKYATEEKTRKQRYGYVGKLTAFHDDMILALPFFTSTSAAAPLHIAWMPRTAIKTSSRGFACQPAMFRDGRPVPLPSRLQFFDAAGLNAFARTVDG
jgi:hypothetical protein